MIMNFSFSSGSDTMTVACNTCNKTFPEIPLLLKCSGCGLAYYCSKEHEISNSPVHKTYCEIAKFCKNELLRNLSQGNKLTSINLATINYDPSWNRNLINKIIHKLIWFSQCDMCHKSLLSDIDNVFCENCSSVSYCSKEHREMHLECHSRWCEILKIRLSLDGSTSFIVVTAKPPNYVKNTEKISQESFFSDMTDFLNGAEINVTPIQKQYLDKYLLSEIFTNSTTILHTFFKCDSLKKFDKNVLNIHISTGYNCFHNDSDLLDVKAWEAVFTYLAKLKVLNIKIFFPKRKEINKICKKIEHHDYLFSPNSRICSLFIELKGVDYITYLQKPAKYCTPDLVLFPQNDCSSLSEVPKSFKTTKLFSDSLRAMCRFPKTIFLFMTNRKCQGEIGFKLFEKITQNNKLVHISKEEENPFRSLFPNVHVGPNMVKAVKYKNHFITILHT